MKIFNTRKNLFPIPLEAPLALATVLTGIVSIK